MHKARLQLYYAIYALVAYKVNKNDIVKNSRLLFFMNTCCSQTKMCAAGTIRVYVLVAINLLLWMKKMNRREKKLSKS